MSEKLTLTPDQIVTRLRGWVTYIDSNGTQRKIRAHLVEVVGAEPKAEESSPAQDEPAAAEESKTSEESTMGDASKKKRKATKKANGHAVRTISGKAFDLSRYEKVKTAAGGVSYNNGDEVANLLQGKELDAVYKTVAAKTKVEESELRKKYKHLNAGMQRMNLGNRLRKVLIPKAAR